MKRETHCGVLEFVADEGRIYIPYEIDNAKLYSNQNKKVLESCAIDIVILI